MIPPLSDLLDSARVVALPMHSRFRGVDVREALLFEGPEGWAEFSPFVEYEDAEAATWLAAAIDFAWREQPEPLRDRIGVNATVPAIEASRVPELLARFPGCRTAKVKVAEPGQTLSDDVARVRAVRETMGPEGRIRVDANGAWNVDEAEHAVHALGEYDLEYVEQPCATVPELADLRRRVKYMGIPVAADESVRKSSDPLAVARAGAADLLVIKAQPLGGITHALQIVTAAGLPVVVSSPGHRDRPVSRSRARCGPPDTRLRLRARHGVAVPRRRGRPAPGRRLDPGRPSDTRCGGTQSSRRIGRTTRMVARAPRPLPL